MTTSIETPIAPELIRPLQAFMDNHPDWSQKRIMAAALALFLMQNGERDRAVSRVYLDSIFNNVAE